MGKYFGTDGIRGIAGTELSADFAFRVGRAAALFLRKERPLCLIGRDTRESSAMLSAALTGGFCAQGADVADLGVISTPAVAFLTKKYGADLSVMVSASHNPWEYNGIKIFNSQGYKLAGEDEDKVERLIDGGSAPSASIYGEQGLARTAAAEYQKHLLDTVDTDVSGIRLVADCANGSASFTAGGLFSALGCRYELIHAEPDGRNINTRCGSTDLRSLKEAVLVSGADIGIAFDGDADRCLCVDEKGNTVDGDIIMTLLALERKQQGKLPGGAMVGTVMTNLGIIQYCRERGVVCETAPVGDRFVLEMMLEKGYMLGGEQSGHIIFREYATTGDGQLTALQVLQYLARQKKARPGRTLSELAGEPVRFPQVLENIEVTAEKKREIMQSAALKEAVEAAERRLGSDGRVLVRASGTEDRIRILTEAREAAMAGEVTAGLRNLIKKLVTV